MEIIKDNDTLMQYIPNVVMAVEGENDLYTKIMPHLTVAESWLFRNVVKQEAVEGAAALVLARSVIAAEAFRNAIPSLNVILTENGFGIVSNGSVAPASKDRTDTLAEVLVGQRDNAIEQLVLLLDGNGTTFAGTVFRGFEAQRLQGVTSHLFDRFAEQRPKVLAMQRNLAEDALTDNVLNTAVCFTYNDESERPEGYNDIFLMVQHIIVKQLKGEGTKSEIRRLVEFVRTHTAEFPGWADSSVSRKWEDHTFKNDMKSGGYWL